jgi:hypothetical protein
VGHEPGCERRGNRVLGEERSQDVRKGGEARVLGDGRSQGGEGVGEARVLGGGGGTEVSGKRAVVNTA